MKRFLYTIFSLLISVTALQADFLEKPVIRTHITLLKQVYRINEPVLVYFTVINTGNKPVTIHLSRDLHRNFAFRVSTLQNIRIKQRDDYFLKIMEARSRDIKGRPLTLQPGERFGRTIDIASRLRLTTPNHYRLTGYFFLQPKRTEQDTKYSSNNIRFILKPPLAVARIIKRHQRLKRKYIGKRLSAAETVDFTIRAKRKQDWINYFRFMDLHKLVNVFSVYSKQYAITPFTRKYKVIHKFKEYLKVFPAKKIIRFFVKRVVITRDQLTMGENAQVECRIIYKKDRLKERKLYYFSLYRKMDRWYIYKYYVVNK